MKRFIREWVVPFLIAFIVYLLISKFVFQILTVPTGSMIGTIKIGDKLYVNKMFDIEKVKRGDILVFKSHELNENLVKRLIGFPGDTVEIKFNGDVYVNGNKLSEPYSIKSSDVEKIFEVPEDCYFFLGDNRPISADARYWKNPYINKKDIKGKAIFIVFPFDRIGKLE